ncbi:MAG: hypothetical protein Q4E01_07720, partial [Actinomycetaceae bacterium]|nr:hypothetical protein [Actinomycetaceae bacterium]
HVFGWLDLVSARTFEPLTLGQSPVAVVGDYLPALRSIAAASGAFWASLERMSVADVVHQMEHANLAGRAVVVEDLGALLRAVDEWAVGFAQEWWRSWLSRSIAVAVGVEASDYSLVRSWSRTMLSLTLQQTRALGVPRAAAGKLVAYPWDAVELAPISLVRPDAPQSTDVLPDPHPALDLVVTPIRDAKNLSHELNRRLRAIRRSKTASERAGKAFDCQVTEPIATDATQNAAADRVWLVGEIPPQIRSDLEVAGGVQEVMEVSESQLLAGGFRPAADDVLVVGRLSRHAARSVKLPGFVSADVLESGALWACKCEAWYRLERVE